MFDAIKSILYLEQRVQERQKKESGSTGGALAPGACHKNDLAPAGPGPQPHTQFGHKNDITTSVVIKANCSSQHRVLLLMKASS